MSISKDVIKQCLISKQEWQLCDRGREACG